MKVCVGLDPRDEQDIFAFNRSIINQIHDLVDMYKANLAFYAGIDGQMALRNTIQYAHEMNTPIILDAKYGDIGATAEAYAKSTFETWQADGVTLNPYLGHDSIQPFLEYDNKDIFVLCHTSNAGAQDIQELDTNGQPLYMRVADQWADQVGLVVGATYSNILRKIRERFSNTCLLVPGIGAQGGDLSKVLQDVGDNAIITSSRSVIYANNPREVVHHLRRKLLAYKLS